MLVLACIVQIGVYRMVVHREQAEEIVIAFENGFGKSMLDGLTDDEFVEVESEFTWFQGGCN